MSALRIVARTVAIALLIGALAAHHQFGERLRRERIALNTARVALDAENQRASRLASIRTNAYSASMPLEQAISQSLHVLRQDAKRFGIVVSQLDFARDPKLAAAGDPSWRALGEPVEGQERARVVQLVMQASFSNYDGLKDFLQRAYQLPIALKSFEIEDAHLKNMVLEVYGVVNPVSNP